MGIGIEPREPQVKADRLPEWLRHHMALDSDRELRVVAVRTAQQVHPLDGPQRVRQ